MRFDFTTTASPEQVLRALTDFTESRLETWNRTLDPKTYELRGAVRPGLLRGKAVLDHRFGSSFAMTGPTRKRSVGPSARPATLLTPATFRVNLINMKMSRPYTMRARAESAAATRARILEAATAAMRRQFRPEVRLDAVAAEAGVTVQTVLRIFGSKRQLLDEVTEIAARDVAVEFAGVRPGDVAAIVHATINHYEKVGDLVIRNIQDETDPEIHAFVEGGRALHRAGTDTGFAPYL